MAYLITAIRTTNERGHSDCNFVHTIRSREKAVQLQTQTSQDVCRLLPTGQELTEVAQAWWDILCVHQIPASCDEAFLDEQRRPCAYWKTDSKLDYKPG